MDKIISFKTYVTTKECIDYIFILYNTYSHKERAV